MNLFIDTTNGCLVLVLENNNQVIDTKIIKDLIKISDVSVEEVKTLLTKNHLTIKDIHKLYVTLGPGSYTGVRVGVSIVKTLKAIDDCFEVYTISSLHYQAGLKNAISLLDAKGQKYYLGIYENGKNIICDQVILEEYIEDFTEQFSTFEILKDYQELDFVNNYLDLKSEFQLQTNINDIEPIYIKSYV
ncbi:glycoprotease [Spiroplasma clarkii]|uniref:Glycoprotease n=1 Tax=Spiroplasma clarkii TaxID=2139 RepID=A0A1Y0L354_9MOLU|nr:tRNA (adenosine(37)-N6)-threonylcarbamoyltransferase complex dimerization subunit type 1 TsaB [Spiroplasma clarkii]ARU92155.1 glycoprotease [Spiroplasma clarkii]ATX71487.1 glycoprotease [Spiroplasma clarkii]